MSPPVMAMRDLLLVLLTVVLAIAGVVTGLMYVGGLESLADIKVDTLCVATLLLFGLAGCTWMVTVHTRERGRYSHLSSSDKVDLAVRGEIDDKFLNRKEMLTYRRRVAEDRLDRERAAADRGGGGIPQHVYDEFPHPKEYYDALMPKDPLDGLPDDDPHVVMLQEWSDETVIIEDEEGRRVYHEGPPEPQWVKENRERPGPRRRVQWFRKVQ